MNRGFGHQMDWSPHWSPQWTPEGLEPSMTSYLNPNFCQDFAMNTNAVTIPETVRMKRGIFSEMHSKVSEAGIPVTATHFDLHREMLWMGNHTGHVKSFLGPTMAHYSSFQVHATDAIRHMQSLEEGMLFLSKSNLRCYTRGGLVMFDYRMEEGADMHSLLMTDNMLLMGGLQNYVVEVDLNTLQETQKFRVEVPGATMMRQTNRFFFFGHPFGKVTLRDLRTSSIREFDTFPGGLSDFDVHGNLLAACGFSRRGLNERYLMVYDLRMMRAATPLWVHVDPLFVRFIPTYTSQLAIISQTGECQFCEPTGLANVADIFHVNTKRQVLTSFEVSSSKQALAFGDSGGCVRLWSDTRDVMFNVYSREPCVADTQRCAVVPQLSWNHDLQPFSPIPTAQATPSPRWAPGMDPEIPQTTGTVGFDSYVENPYICPCNQGPFNKEGTPCYGYYNHVPESPAESDEEPLLHIVPEKYRKVSIKYSKRGRDDFDFKHYNGTLFAGLEPQIPNAYCNSMIQVLYFLEPVRCLVQNHLCHKEFCLACELGFHFHMLDLSQGDPCQASNFLRALRHIPEAKELSLILSNCEETAGTVELGRLIQRWNHFILYQLFQETQEQEDPRARSSSLGSSVIRKLFCSEVENSSLCLCGIETVHSSLMSLFNMHYPDSQGKRIKECDFAEILKKSICAQQRAHTWCEKCQKYQPSVQTRNIRRLPDVLVLNCEVNSSKEAEFWKVQAEYAFNKAMQKADQDQWIPATLKMSLSKGRGLEISSWPEGQELSAAEEAEGASLYDLVVTVPHILDAGTGDHLVAHINVGETYHQRKEGVSRQQWYLFNDFLIEPIDKTEAAQFDVSWKVPAILYYAKRNYHTKYDLRSKCQRNTSEVKSDLCRTQKQRKTDAAFMPLTVSEMPQAGDLVGLDAEFVMLRQEEAVMRSDGTKSIIKPSHMSVARITCVRGQGPNEGVPFIDDYISTQEQVVDYLTKYSGINPGDLDATVSSKHVTTLKSTYLKLRSLIDAGVRFVGHGLQNDFRVINLVVPKDQVIDTVHLFHLPYKRMISLKFLAWYFLGLNIQGETHDSTEDSCAALKLYRKYLELYQEGGNHYVTKVLYEVYDKGFELNWKVPDSDTR